MSATAVGGKPLQIRVDGLPAAGGWPLDRGLHYGDGLFETMRVRGGRVRFEALHRSRLAGGLARLRIGLDEQAAWEEVRALARAHPQSMLKLLVTRGDATARGYGAAGDERPRRVLLAYATAPEPAHERRDAVLLSACFGENPLLAGLKHTSRLEQVLARAELAATGAWEGLVRAGSGLLVSGTISNVYLRRQGQWLTPRIDRCGIAGVVRAAALREAAAAGVALTEADIPAEALRDCDSVWVSNARIGLVRLESLDGRPLDGDAAMSRLADRLEQLDD